MKKIITLLAFTLFVLTNTYDINPWHIEKPFDRVVIWGHKQRGATEHFWVHWGFWRAFLSLGYDTIWLDSTDDIQNIDFTNTLFVTEGQDDTDIPLLSGCRYVLHQCDPTKYQTLIDDGDCIFLECFTNEALDPSNTQTTSYIATNTTTQKIYMPWATDNLPEEIDNNKRQVTIIKDTNFIYWITNIGDPIVDLTTTMTPFQAAATEQGYIFQIENGSNIRDNLIKTQYSYMQPTLVGEEHLQSGYIPCRIFKNISLGQIGITNAPVVYNLFAQNITYNTNTYQLFFDAQNALNTTSEQDLMDLMDIVRDNHTYANRIDYLFDFMNEIKPLH